jgi:hypothetical protein
MTVYDSSYSSAATVVGLVLQELDSANNVIFEWASWDHFGILDANHVFFQNIIIDAVHCNAVERDNDGNILICSRHLSEITKINRTTGNIMWRMGGNKNEFSFPNDAQKISYQHDVRRLANGHITVFDNGNYHTPIRTYVKEYEVDEVNKIATLVWSYSHEYNGNYMYSIAMGSAQRLPNGNTFIAWGLVYGNGYPAMTEVDSMGNVVWEMKFNNNSSTCYRALKHVWEPCKNLIDSTGFVADSITAISAFLKWGSNSKIAEYILEYKECGDTTWNKIVIESSNYLLTDLLPNTCYQWRVATVCSIYSDTIFYSVQTFTTDFGVAINVTDKDDKQLKIFPNPVIEVMFAEYTAKEKREVTVLIYNAAGISFYENKILVLPGNNKLSLELFTFSPGVYFLEIQSSNEVLREKFFLF